MYNYELKFYFLSTTASFFRFGRHTLFIQEQFYDEPT